MPGMRWANQPRDRRRGIAAALLLLAAGLLPAWAETGPPEPETNRPARIVINVPSRTLTLYLDGTRRKVYSVGVGQRRWQTPIGQWEILEKVANPTWGYPYNDYKGSLPVIPPGKRNPLGTRWMGFTKKEHGIHGTNLPQTVGKVISHGCVRMRMRDAEELFELVRVGTPVEVRHDTVRVSVDAAKGHVWVAAYPDVYRKGRASRARVEAELRRQGVRAALSAGTLRRVFARADGKFHVVGRVVTPAPLPSGTP